jgi:hypothetical protein
MSGKHGAKQKTVLTEEQKSELRHVLGDNRTVLSLDETSGIIKRWGLSWSAIRRRSVASGISIRTGYSWSEFVSETNPKTKRFIFFECCVCGSLVEMLVCKFTMRKKLEPVCKEHYFQLFVYDDEWRHKNSAAQLIAQNKAYVREQHRYNTTQMWIQDRERLVQINRRGIEKRFSDSKYRRNWSESIKARWQDPTYRAKINGKGKWKHVGAYSGIQYDSLTELAFILWQLEIGSGVRRYDGIGIQYVYDGKVHGYYPDFFVDPNVIVEVKSQYWYLKHREIVEEKSSACVEYCKLNGLSFRLVFCRDIPYLYRKKAKQIHEASRQEKP